MPNEELVATEISKLESDLYIMGDLQFTCDICNDHGEELIYLCDKCGRSMHPRCAGVKTWIVFDTVDGKKEIATDNLPNSCSICLREPEDIYSFQASSSSSITSYIESGKELLHKIIEGEDQWIVHKHKTGHELRQMDNNTIYSCSGCKMESFGLHYACENPSCTFLLHKECNSPRKNTMHQFFPKLTLVFGCLHNSEHSKKAHTNVFCNACGMNVKGYYYHSFDGEKNLHPCCINLAAETICCENNVKMVLKEKTTSICGYCNKRSVKVGSEWTDNIWSYVTENEKVHLHVGCMIKMLSDMREDKMGRLKSCKMSSKNGQGDMNLELELVHGSMWAPRKEKIKIFNKYAKIALGTVIAALLGEARTLVVHSLFS